MKFSNNYILYPNSNVLERVIEHYKTQFPELASQNKSLDEANQEVVIHDNLRNTRGNFEQRKYKTKLLESVQQAFESALTEKLRKQAPLDWATTQDSLGQVLATLGQQQGDTGLSEKAIQAFEHALEERTEENTPESWASTQNSLAAVLLDLGQHESNTKLLKLAVDSYTNILRVWTHIQAPQEWASSMHNLGVAFHAHGKLMQGNRTFQKSVVAYKNALAERDIEREPIDWAISQNNRGAVLHDLAAREENAERMEEAIRAYEKALRIWVEQLLPIHLATMIMANRSTARTTLAELTKDAAIAEQAAEEFVLILGVFNIACHPHCLKHCEEQQEKALALVETLGENEKS